MGGISRYLATCTRLNDTIRRTTILGEILQGDRGRIKATALIVYVRRILRQRQRWNCTSKRSRGRLEAMTGYSNGGFSCACLGIAHPAGLRGMAYAAMGCSTLARAEETRCHDGPHNVLTGNQGWRLFVLCVLRFADLYTILAVTPSGELSVVRRDAWAFSVQGEPGQQSEIGSLLVDVKGSKSTRRQVPEPTDLGPPDTLTAILAGWVLIDAQ